MSAMDAHLSCRKNHPAHVQTRKYLHTSLLTLSIQPTYPTFPLTVPYVSSPSPSPPSLTLIPTPLITPCIHYPPTVHTGALVAGLSRGQACDGAPYDHQLCHLDPHLLCGTTQRQDFVSALSAAGQGASADEVCDGMGCDMMLCHGM